MVVAGAAASASEEQVAVGSCCLSLRKLRREGKFYVYKGVLAGYSSNNTITNFLLNTCFSPIVFLTLLVLLHTIPITYDLPLWFVHA